MNIFKKLFGKKAPIMTEEEFLTRFADVVDMIQESHKPAVGIKAKRSKKPLPVTTSKFGGIPLITESNPIPVDSDGKSLDIIFQVNLEEIPHLDILPKTGILQFWLEDGNWSDGIVRYISKSDFDNALENTGFKNHNDCPVQDEYLIESKLETMSMTSTTYPIDPASSTEIDGAFLDYIGYDLSKLNDMTGKDIFVDISELDHLGGHANFTQWDPRGGQDEYKDYIVLFQIGTNDNFMWGDLGQICWLIHPDDLTKLDFSKVHIYGDCS